MTWTVWGVFLVFACLWLWLFYDRGFNIPDEGNQVYPALRILRGEMPHRDFATLYTGGVYYLYALFFTLFGIQAGVIRVATAIVVGLIAVLTIRITARFTGHLWAVLPGLAVILAFPLNSTSYSSWYAVLWGVLSLLGVLHYLNTPHLRYLILAGLGAGGSFLAKQTMGMFILSALIGFVLWYSPLLSSPTWTGWDRVFRGFCLCLAAAVYTRFLQPAWAKAAFVGVLFLSPLWLMALTVWIFGSLNTSASSTTSNRFTPPAFSALLAIVLGFVLPTGVYAGSYAWHGGLMALVEGVFRFPGRYLTQWVEGSSYPPPLAWILNAVGTFLALLVWPSWSVTQRWSSAPVMRFLWRLLCVGLLVYPVRLIIAGSAYRGNLLAFLSWANDAIFFSLIFYMPVVIPWLVLSVLLIERIRPGSFDLSAEQRVGISAVYVFHVYLFFCVYPVMHPIILVYTHPTTLLKGTFLAHLFWTLTTVSGWRSLGWGLHVRRTVALISLVSLPVVAMLAFLIWGTQYWIGLRVLASDGRVMWDDRVPIRVSRGGWGFVLKREEAAPIEAVCRYLQAHTAPTEPVFVAATSGPLILFFSERHTPSRTHFPLGRLTQADQDEMVSALERTHTRYIVVDWHRLIQDAAILWQVIETRYTLETEIGEYRVFRRR